MKRAILFSLGFALLTGASARAATRRVPSQYSRIQSAISDCNDGDVVVVEPDRYYELINFLGKNIVVTSTDPNDPEIVAETVIDGDGEGSVVTFENGESHEAVLTGFTITGGYGTVAADLTGEYIIWGTGIYCREASPTITKNVIRDNQGPVVVQNEEPVALSYGAGIGCLLSDAIVTGNTIRGNTGYAGAGIMSYVGSARISNNFIYHNSAAIGGGVIIIAGGWLTNNTIVGNDAGVQVPGGESGLVGNVYVTGVAELGIQPLISNNIIAEAVSGGGIFTLDIPDEGIRYNNVWNNSPGNYLTQAPGTGEIIFDGEADRTGINGNISEDPRFFDPPDDYHLESGSPCISKGDPAFLPEPGETDIDGEARVFAVRVDIGADEFVGYVKPVAFAGPDQHVAAPGLITLDGSGSHFDESVEQRDFIWSQEDGSPVELSDPEAMSPTFTPEFEGLYLFELVVGDGTNVSEADEVIVLVGNKPPVANAGTNRICKVPERISLDGSASYDPDDIDDLTYSWRQVEGPSVVLHDAETPEPFFDCSEEGAYVFELIVNDGFVDSQPSLVKVTSVVFTLNQQAVDAGYQADGYFHYVDVSGAKVVYAVGMISDDSWDIKCKDLETDEVESFSGGGIDTQPKIDGDIVVWSGGPFISGARDTECTSVFVRNVGTGQQRTLRQHSDTASYSHPAVSGNKVVWLQHINIDKNSPDDWSNMPYDICGADITDINNPVYFTVAERVDNRDPYPVDSYAEDFDRVIDLSGDIVVWVAEGDIYGADISDLAEIRSFQICIDGARQYDPAVSGNVVVWTDERNDEGDIYGADISDIDNITEFRIAGGGQSQLQPATDGCLVVYVQGSIYGGLIKAACLTRENSVMDVELLNSPVGTGP
ncbi:MAG: hypothetical protein JSU94_11380, partial [Phycisphaerales bacterium]